MPERVQLSRRRGWRMPENTWKVSRGTHLGNPFRVYEHCKGKNGDWGVEDTGRFNRSLMHGMTKLGATRFAIDCYKQEFDKVYPPGSTARKLIAARLHDVNVACFCPLDQPCHADFLLEVGQEEPELAAALRAQEGATDGS